jgi:HK97 family phage prohead protease
MPVTKQQERRFVPNAEVRLEEGADGPILTGYAAVFDKWSVDLWGFREKIRKGAFKKTIKEADVRGLINHDSNLIFGRSTAQTLELREDDGGLRYESPLDEGITYVSDLIKSVRR